MLIILMGKVLRQMVLHLVKIFFFYKIKVYNKFLSSIKTLKYLLNLYKMMNLIKNKVIKNDPKKKPKTYLTQLNTTAILNKSLILVQQALNNLDTTLINSDTILGSVYFYNLKIPNRLIDILKDDRLCNITLNSINIKINLGTVPFEFINGIKITNGTGGEHTINLDSVQNIYFPFNGNNSIPSVNKIKFTANSKAGETIDIIWYNAPFIHLVPGYRVITSSTNIDYHTV